MKAQTILEAIRAMQAMDGVSYTTDPREWGKKAFELSRAEIHLRCELEAELPDIKIERAA